MGALAIDSGSQLVVLTVHAVNGSVAKDYDVEYAAPAGNMLFHVGDTIFADYSRSGGGFGPENVDLTLSHGQAIDIYIGYGGSVSDLNEAPFKFAQGPQLCVQNDTCGTWAAYDLSIVLDTTTQPVPYGSYVINKTYRVLNGGVREQLPTSNTQCADWYVADVRVYVTNDAPF